MTTHIIRRMDQGRGWLARPGSPNAYTHVRANARTFPTLEDAKRECCGNETPEPL